MSQGLGRSIGPAPSCSPACRSSVRMRSLRYRRVCIVDSQETRSAAHFGGIPTARHVATGLFLQRSCIRQGIVAETFWTYQLAGLVFSALAKSTYHLSTPFRHTRISSICSIGYTMWHSSRLYHRNRHRSMFACLADHCTFVSALAMIDSAACGLRFNAGSHLKHPVYVQLVGRSAAGESDAA